MKKLGTYILCSVLGVVLICSGVFCGISWYKKAHAQSHIIGSLDIDNSYTLESFSYSNAKHPIVFYLDEEDTSDLYYFKEELEKVPSFDGDKKQYEITLNNYLVLEPTVLFRAVKFTVPILFQDLDGSILCDTSFDVIVKFYNDKTVFEINMHGNENRQYVERYILANGFELFITEVTK